MPDTQTSRLPTICVAAWYRDCDENREVALHGTAECGLDLEPSSTSVIDVLDHVLDKGIVIEPWVVLSLRADDLASRQAHLVVASVWTGTAQNRGSRHATGDPERGARAPDGRRLEDQLQRFRDQMDRHQFDPQKHRRAEDRVLDELRDANARTIHH